jgi:hypothetical protein
VIDDYFKKNLIEVKQNNNNKKPMNINLWASNILSD